MAAGNSIAALRLLTVDTASSSAAHTALDTAIKSAPAATNGAQLRAVIPPIATQGISLTVVHHPSMDASAKCSTGLVGVGKNAPAGNGRRIEEGHYPLSTQDGAHYKTWNYDPTENIGKNPKPGFLVLDTNQRVGILVHPGKNSFLSSVGCFNPCTSLPTAAMIIDYKPSRARVIAMIEDMKGFAGSGFPTRNGRRIPNAFIVVDGEP